MDNEVILKIELAIFTFILGLISKFLYDIWSQRRAKKNILFEKSIVTSFTREQLEESIRPNTKVTYSGHDIDSICVARVEAKNVCSSPLRNQVYTVEFSEGAKILGEPKLVECTEDQKFIIHDSDNDTDESRKFIMMLLRPKRQVVWDFTVINHKGDFSVKHSIQSKTDEFSEADLDVEPIYSIEGNRQAELSLELRLITIVTLLIAVQIANLINNSFPRFLDIVVNPVINLIQISLWLLIIGVSAKTIKPLLDWFKANNLRVPNTVEIDGDRNFLVLENSKGLIKVDFSSDNDESSN